MYVHLQCNVVQTVCTRHPHTTAHTYVHTYASHWVLVSPSLQAGNQTATIVALCSLLDFDLRQDTSQMAIRDVGGMDLLVNLLETNDLKCRIGALKIMTELTQNTQTRIDITNLGGTHIHVSMFVHTYGDFLCYIISNNHKSS